MDRIGIESFAYYYKPKKNLFVNELKSLIIQ